VGMKEEILALSAKYNCSPDDPLFAILEKIEGYTQAVAANQIPLLPAVKEELKISLEKLGSTKTELVSLCDQMQEYKKEVGEQVGVISKYWLQARWYYAFISFLVSFALFGTAFFGFYWNSADRLLSKSGVQLFHSETNRANRLVLSGPRVLDGKRTDSRVEALFEK